MHNFSLASLASLPPAALKSLSRAEALALLYDWSLWARPEQLAPAGEWDTWLINAGRGFGKARSGAEWVQGLACASPVRVALVASTSADARDIMVEGESGLLAIAHPDRRPTYQPSKRRLVWPNGSIGTLFTAEEPDRLRGPQHHYAWCDELAAWKHAQDTWDNLQFGLRLGTSPRVCVTTTPRPTLIIKALIADATTRVTGGSTFANRAHLPASTLARLKEKYGGTRLGRQELYAEVLDDNPGALWKRGQLDALRVRQAPTLTRVVVAVDPAVSANATSAETGVVVVGLGEDGHGYVLDDRTLSGSPGEWAAAVVTAFNVHRADRVIGEVNNGGDLVESNLRTAARHLPFKAVRASRGKATRAEPIAALYEQGRVHHVGAFPRLEDQLVDWDPTGGAPSPDRLDALVWGLTELMLGNVSDDDGGLDVFGRSSR